MFRQDHSFDLRVYGVNNSGTLPNYIYINNVQLKQTAAPGAVAEILNTDEINKTSFTMDLSFNLDASDTTITSGISVAHYDISFTLSDTKSLDTRTHRGNYFIEWRNATDLGKDNIQLPNLYPGAKYDIQIRAKNPLKYDLDRSHMKVLPPPKSICMVNMDLFLHQQDLQIQMVILDGLNTTRYLETSDLNSVDPSGMKFTLNNDK